MRAARRARTRVPHHGTAALLDEDEDDAGATSHCPYPGVTLTTNTEGRGGTMMHSQCPTPATNADDAKDDGGAAGTNKDNAGAMSCCPHPTAAATANLNEDKDDAGATLRCPYPTADLDKDMGTTSRHPCRSTTALLDEDKGDMGATLHHPHPAVAADLDKDEDNAGATLHHPCHSTAALLNEDEGDAGATSRCHCQHQ